MTTNFAFLPPEFRTVAESAARAEGHIMGDPRAAIVESVEQQKARMRAHLAGQDALFACLQSRVFNGEL